MTSSGKQMLYECGDCNKAVNCVYSVVKLDHNQDPRVSFVCESCNKNYDRN